MPNHRKGTLNLEPFFAGIRLKEAWIHSRPKHLSGALKALRPCLPGLSLVMKFCQVLFKFEGLNRLWRRVIILDCCCHVGIANHISQISIFSVI